MSVKFSLPEWNNTKCFRCVLFRVMYTIFNSNSFENLIGCNCGTGWNSDFQPALQVPKTGFSKEALWKRYFRHSKRTFKPVYLKNNCSHKNDFALISLLLYVKKFLNNFFATISVKKSQNPNFRNLEKFSCEQLFSR